VAEVTGRWDFLLPPRRKRDDALHDLWPRNPLTIRSIAEILALPDDPADLILSNGYLERGERTAICGMGGIGKSRLIMQMAMMHRAGLPFLAWETRAPHLRWLFLQTENGNRRLKSDLTAMLTAFTPAQRAAIQDGIAIHTLEGEDDGFLILTDEDAEKRAIAAIQNSGAEIVVFDLLPETHRGGSRRIWCHRAATRGRAGGLP
jgi:AAA domain